MSESENDRAAPVPRRWLTKGEAAQYLRISEYQLDQMVRDGDLVRYSVRGKRSWRWDIADLDALLNEQSTEPGSASGNAG